jgi:hypothetical protein
MIIRKIWINCSNCTKWYILEVLVQFRKLDWKINCDFQIIRKWITDIVWRFRKTFRIPAIIPANHHKWRHNHHLRWPNSFLNLHLFSSILVFIFCIFSIYLVFIIIILLVFVIVDFLFLLLTFDFLCFVWLSFSVIFDRFSVDMFLQPPSASFLFQKLLQPYLSSCP